MGDAPLVGGVPRKCLPIRWLAKGPEGQEIIAAILQGERDPWKLADLKHYRVRASREEMARSLEGNWREDVLFELQQAVDSWEP